MCSCAFSFACRVCLCVAVTCSLIAILIVSIPRTLCDCLGPKQTSHLSVSLSASGVFPSSSSRRLSLLCKSLLSLHMSNLSPTPECSQQSHLWRHSECVANNLCWSGLQISVYLYEWSVYGVKMTITIMIIYNLIILVVFSYCTICCWKEKHHAAKSIDKLYVSHVSAGVMCVFRWVGEKYKNKQLFFYFSVCLFLLHISSSVPSPNTCHLQPDCCFDHVTYLIPQPLGMSVSFLK